MNEKIRYVNQLINLTNCYENADIVTLLHLTLIRYFSTELPHFIRVNCLTYNLNQVVILFEYVVLFVDTCVCIWYVQACLKDTDNIDQHSL